MTEFKKTATIKRTPPKYRNVKTEVDGQIFDSKREAVRYGVLKMRQMAGEISNLRTQVVFPIEIAGVKICKYVADFCYTEKNKEITEDAKGIRTPVYNLKKKLMLAVYGIEIQEI